MFFQLSKVHVLEVGVVVCFEWTAEMGLGEMVVRVEEGRRREGRW